MRLTSVLTPLNDHPLALAAQCGVKEITMRHPGPELESLRQTKAQIEHPFVSARAPLWPWVAIFPPPSVVSAPTSATFTFAMCGAMPKLLQRHFFMG